MSQGPTRSPGVSEVGEGVSVIAYLGVKRAAGSARAEPTRHVGRRHAALTGIVLNAHIAERVRTLQAESSFQREPGCFMRRVTRGLQAASAPPLPMGNIADLQRLIALRGRLASQIRVGNLPDRRCSSACSQIK